MSHRTKPLIALLLLASTGCEFQEKEFVPVRGSADLTTSLSRAFRIGVATEESISGLQIRIDGEPVNAETDKWPPDLLLPQDEGGIAIAFHADSVVAFGKLRPLLRVLAEFPSAKRLVLVENLETQADQWHWAKDFDLEFPRPITGMTLPNIRVRLAATDEGAVAGVFLGMRNLGEAPEGYERLNREILKIIGRPGDPITRDLVVELDADDEVPWREVRAVLLACVGRQDKYGKWVRYIEHLTIAGVTDGLEPEFEEEIEAMEIEPVGDLEIQSEVSPEKLPESSEK